MPGVTSPYGHQPRHRSPGDVRARHRATGKGAWDAGRAPGSGTASRGEAVMTDGSLTRTERTASALYRLLLAFAATAAVAEPGEG